MCQALTRMLSALACWGGQPGLSVFMLPTPSVTLVRAVLTCQACSWSRAWGRQWWQEGRSCPH